MGAGSAEDLCILCSPVDHLLLREESRLVDSSKVCSEDRHVALPFLTLFKEMCQKFTSKELIHMNFLRGMTGWVAPWLQRDLAGPGNL